MSTSFQIVQNNLDSMAMGVIESDDEINAKLIPGTSFSIISAVVSGVMSRDVNPVPPVVNMQSTSERFDHRMRNSFKTFLSSETI
ncbi:hypothetical protein DERP_009593 [Dermatophagoides pteronyssinus]|uniref:Uncharacterized protein n=1 Tax=Dermatophagoides pteronyssinus TaxID=6956 RepID=A0ABQ8JAA4_DERPT|nr:hypothetical protein DERP_009593 [Dermatophagoides pteronyssinus]